MKVFLYLVTLAIGIGVGYSLAKVPHQNISTGSPVIDGLFDLRSKMKEITEKDFVEYKQLKDLRAKYEKADEILSKIMLIFISDLGLKVNRRQFSDLKTGPANEAEKPAVADSVANDSRSKESEDTLKSLRNLNDKIATIRNDADVDKLVSDAKIDNLADVFSAFKPVHKMDGAMAQFLGEFSGQISLYVEDQRVLPASMSFQLEGDKIRFAVHVEDTTMYKTDFTGTADVDGFFDSLDGASQSIFLSADQYSYRYFQLFYVPGTSMLVGNFYKKWVKPGEYKAIGAVKLRRR